MWFFFFFSSRRRHTRWTGDWSSDVCSSDLGFWRYAIRSRKLVQKCVRSRQVMRHDALRPIGFVYSFAGIRRNLLLRRVNEIRTADKRLGQIHRVIHKDNNRQVVAVPQQSGGYSGFVASGNAVSPNPAFLEVVGRDGEDVSFPFSRREALPCVRRIVGRMRPSIHIDRLLGGLPGDVRVVRNKPLRIPVHFLPDSEQRWPTPRIVGRVWPALIL